MSSGWTTLLRWAQRLFGDDLARRVFEPLFADWCHEREQAAGPFARGAVTVRWTAALARAILDVAWQVTLRPAPADPPWWRAAAVLGLFSAVGTVVLIYPFVVQGMASSEHPLRGLRFLVPQALTVALAFALLPAAMVLGGGLVDAVRRQTRRKQVAALTVVATLVTTATAGWVVPDANQAFRVGMAGANLQRGLRERTVVELWNPVGIDGVAARQELRSRLSLGVLWPLALACLGWRLGRRRVRMSLGALAAAWAGAALLMAIVNPLIVAGRDVPTLLIPWLWLLLAMLVRPQGSRETDTPFLRRR